MRSYVRLIFILIIITRINSSKASMHATVLNILQLRSVTVLMSFKNFTYSNVN